MAIRLIKWTAWALVVVSLTSIGAHCISEVLYVSTSSSDITEKRVLESVAENLAKKEQELAQYRNDLKENGCQDISLEFCASLLYAINHSNGFKDPDLFDRWQESILGDYITREQVFRYGETGKGLDVVYFRDSRGSRTNEPAICYVVNPKIKKFRISDIESAIDFWEKLSPGFLRALVENNVRILFQSQASSNPKTSVFKYGNGIIYYNYSRTDSGVFANSLVKGFGVEMFGVKGDALGGVFDKYAVGVIKSRLATDCCEYIANETGNSKMNVLIESYQYETGWYTKDYWTDRGKSEAELLTLIRVIKDNNLMTPYGAESWDEIDSVADL